MTEHPLCTDPSCGVCAQRRATAGFHGEQLHEPEVNSVVTCPQCGHPFDPRTQAPERVTESAPAAEAKDPKKPYGEVEYADPGHQADGKKRYPIDTEDHVRAAWSYINQAKNAAKYGAADLKKVKARIKAAMRRLDIAVSENSITEAMINGSRSWDDIRELVRRAVRARLHTELDGYCWAYIVDISDTDVVYMAEGDKLYQCAWSLAGDAVTLGEAVAVERTYAPVSAPAGDAGDQAEGEAAAETTGVQRDTLFGRVVEAKGKDEAGNRIFRIQVIAYGDSKNGRRYSEQVMRAAVPLYEGAKAYDHHRTTEEMTSGTIQGLVGHLRGVEATDHGVEADLHLLPSATHAAEALDASLAAQTEGMGPLVGISHDVYARFRPIQENGRQIHEATEITGVNSADIVSHPAAGGMATRAVAGGINPDDAKEPDVGATKADVLAAFQEATVEELAAVGLARAGSTETEDNPAGDKATETTEAAKPGEPEKTTEAGDTHPKGSVLGRMLIRSKVEDAELPAAMVESITAALPDRISEATVDAQIATIKTALGGLERAGLTPTSTTRVTQEALDKKIAALDAFFAGDYTKGYRSFREAFVDITGRRPKAFDEDFNRTILRETFGGGYGPGRSTESLTTTSWDVILGDSVTRRMIAEYGRPSLATWRQVVSSVVPVNDFRTQRLDRLGGYGTLPAVNQGAPYQPLTSPTDEEATYAITKRGGTEDLTLEMIANDDLRSIQRIPTKLGLAAAQTLYRFVWDIFPTNAAASFDATALFAAGHSNTDNPALLTQTTLSTGRRKMRQQAAYGDSSDVLSIVPRTLVVPSALEEIAFQLSTSAVAIPATPAGPSDTPNLHQGLMVIVVDYYSDANDWYLVADPSMCPTIEIGFYQGREQPELFTQADNTVGSMFDSDKLTYKIRHIYSGAVVDYRGFYRGANA